ncbi:VCBS repeat-containing protein [Flagellimonas pacifica]|uniref:Repeat domain-containing protein n=1 Tax=Flagellimonas pacifica TaxID=1247520 RepID=A0A285N1Z3_9FLAO|nr:VCBS repeat-containing protein [Allomuricauda parva]SNZ01751.1 Repeat domain-containing protein [Allomuricauda parva]
MEKYGLPILLFLLILFSCTDSKRKSTPTTLFSNIENSHSNILFNNALNETKSFNYFEYPYFYMGGGVAIGDINNDGLQDVFFTGNQTKNALYLNMGNLVFQDISLRSNTQGGNQWYTGVTFCDVNNDGYLDIYACVSGKNAEKKNELYINNKDLTFTEKAAFYGIADNGSSIQSVFFDYDNDNDLDLYVINYPFTPFSSSLEYYDEKIHNPTLEDSDRFYENTGNGTFVDITEKSGVINFGLSLGVISADFNNDGFQDLYISNDFATPDILYINNGNGTFSNIIKKSTGHTSFYGMGVDASDFNNDGLLDFIQLDMNPEDNKRSKENMASMNPKRFQRITDLGFHYQYMHNTLQLNQGNLDSGSPFFSNISRIAGVSSTDWSWSSLFADFDNDGWKDLYITNGSRKDINNKDFFNKLKARTMFKKDKNYFEQSWDMPSEKLENYIYKNNTDHTFNKSNEDWGIGFKGFSNGASYADLDNDGDLELVINNIDSTAVIYKNNATELASGTYLRFKFKGAKKNPLGLGAKVLIAHKTQKQYQELTLTRGFQSSVEPILHFGTNQLEFIENATITWPDGATQTLKNIETNQVITIDHKKASLKKTIENTSTHKLFKDVTDSLHINFTHRENEYDDFDRQLLLPHKYSNFGPALAVGDVNGDRLDDYYVGGAAEQAGELHIQQEDGSFKRSTSLVWEKDGRFEDVAALFFDADGDGDKDLYIASGGYEFKDGTEQLQDRLYKNDGNGNFSRLKMAIPDIRINSSCIASGDYDNDGDLDLFVGGRIISGKYPYPAKSTILENKSTLNATLFEDVTKHICPQLDSLGLVTSAIWNDFDNDKKLDLVVAGEWMPITIFKNEGSQFLNHTTHSGLEKLTGWWYSVAAGDFDNDGDDDYLVGNLGLNYKYQASEQGPFEVYAKDFDSNGSIDIVLGYYNEGMQYPVRGKQCSTQQIPRLEFQFPNYKSFASASLIDVYGVENLQAALHYKATTFASGYIENISGGRFKFHKLPNLAQFSSINSIIIDDMDKDGHLDALVAGNLYASEVETPRNDAGTGLFLKGDGNGHFEEIPFTESGFLTRSDTKQIKLLQSKNGKIILAAENNSKLKAFQVAQH